MMGIMVLETCWANNKFCNKEPSVVSSWPFYFQVLTTMYGQTHIKGTGSLEGGGQYQQCEQTIYNYTSFPLGIKETVTFFCPDRPWNPPSPLYSGFRLFPPEVKRSGCGADHPPSSVEVKEKIELYLHSRSQASWPVLRWPLPLHVRSSVCALT